MLRQFGDRRNPASECFAGLSQGRGILPVTEVQIEPAGGSGVNRVLKNRRARVSKGRQSPYHATLQKDLLIESAYCGLREKSIDTMKNLQGRGVRVRVLTNSLAPNDVLATQAGLAKRREAIIEHGMELYEYRPDSRMGKTRACRGESKAALHTKTMVFDREAVFIDSFHLDPRSAAINTEAGLYVESPELAQQVIEYIDEGVQPENSYRVLLDENGDLYWVTEVDGNEVRYYKEPETTFGQRFMSGFIMILPVEHQL